MNKPSEIFNANYVCILMLYILYNNCHLWWLILFLDLLEKTMYNVYRHKCHQSSDHRVLRILAPMHCNGGICWVPKALGKCTLDAFYNCWVSKKSPLYVVCGSELAQN